MGLLLLISLATISKAQEKAVYYLNINDATVDKVHEVAEEKLHLQYFDAYGKWEEIPLKIYDWKRNIIVNVVLDKTNGLNNYSLTLSDLYNGWELNKVYVCELKDEAGKKHEISIKLIPPVVNEAPEVNILVNPKHLTCNDLSFALVEFYGEIKGGKAPYTLNWYVLNSHRTAFLYQPKEELINTQGASSYINVDIAPDYYVALFVKDACGNVVKKLVNVACEDNKKKINTLFIEQLNSPIFDTKGKEIR